MIQLAQWELFFSTVPYCGNKMNRMKKLKTSLILLGLGLVLSFGVKAQSPPRPPSDPTAGGNQSPSGPSGAPIDGGTSIFLLLAAGYGIWKVKNEKFKVKSEER